MARGAAQLNLVVPADAVQVLESGLDYGTHLRLRRQSSSVEKCQNFFFTGFKRVNLVNKILWLEVGYDTGIVAYHAVPVDLVVERFLAPCAR